MSNKDYEIRNRDYSSYDYHNRIDSSYTNSDDGLSIVDYHRLINILIITLALSALTIGLYLSLGYEEKSAVKKNTDSSNNKPLISGNHSSDFANRKLISQKKKDISFPSRKKKTPIAIQREEEKKKRIEEQRKKLFDKKTNSSVAMGQKTKDNSLALNMGLKDNKRVPEKRTILTPLEEFKENNKKVLEEIDKYETEFYKKTAELEIMDEKQLLASFDDFLNFYKKYGDITKDKEFLKVSSKDHMISEYAKVAMNNDYSIVFQKLIDNGFDPRSWSFNGLPVIFCSAEKNSYKCLNILLNMGLNLKQELRESKLSRFGFKFNIDEGKTLLHSAAQQGNIDLANRVLKAGVEIDRKTKKGNTPLLYAIKNNQYEMVKFLLDNGAVFSEELKQYTTDARILELYKKEPPTNEKLPLNQDNKEINDDEEWASAYNFIKKGELINLFNLSKDGKDLSKMYYKDEPAPCIAARYNELEILKYLIHEFDCKNIVNRVNKQNALHYAVINNNLEIIRYLLQNGFSPNQADIDGNTPLHCAIDNSFSECADLLLESGADPNLLNNKKQNALHLAVLNDNIDSVNLLLTRRTNINQQDTNGNTCLHYIALFASNNISMLDEFYKYKDKLDFTVKNNDGKTPRDVWESDCFDNYEKKYR